MNLKKILKKVLKYLLVVILTAGIMGPMAYLAALSILSGQRIYLMLSLISIGAIVIGGILKPIIDKL
jgi:hypothetical protein